MATLPLLTEIQAAIGATLTPSLTAASAGSDIFEGYVLSLVLQAAQTEGAMVTFTNVGGPTSGVFTFRTSPGHIWSTVQPYTYAILRLPNVPPLEAHLGVYVSGRSGLIHEADVLVLDAAEAQLCRNEQVPPRSKRSQIAIECKFYSSTLGIGLARSFVGLCSDLSSRECFFVTNTTAQTAEKLLEHQRKSWETELFPNSAISVERFRNALQTVFRNYKTKYAP
jgi:hypothetical protein